MPAPTARFGLGLRKPHYAQVLEGGTPLDFIEVISENFMVPGGRPRDVLARARSHHAVALHGVSLSVGSAAGLDPAYLARLRALVDAIEPVIVSDHLCWTRAGLGAAAHQSHDLLPLPYTEEALALVCAHIDQAQTALGRQMLIENPSTYVQFAASQLSEWEFLAEVTRRSGCALLLDVNNIHVSATNHGWDAHAYLAGLPLDRVRQIHLAGHTARTIEGTPMLIDTHDQPVPDPVWALYGAVMEQLAAAGVAPHVMIERDDNIPPLDALLAELDTARRLAAAQVSA